MCFQETFCRLFFPTRLHKITCCSCRICCHTSEDATAELNVENGTVSPGERLEGDIELVTEHPNGPSMIPVNQVPIPQLSITSTIVNDSIQPE